MSIASFWCKACGRSYHVHEDHDCPPWRVIAPDGREWRNPRLMAAVAAAIEETKLQFPAPASGVAAQSNNDSVPERFKGDALNRLAVPTRGNTVGYVRSNRTAVTADPAEPDGVREDGNG